MTNKDDEKDLYNMLGTKQDRKVLDKQCIIVKIKFRDSHCSS